MARNDEFVADFGKNSVDAFLKVNKWRNEITEKKSSAKFPPEIPKVRKRYTRTKPITNYGAKNGNSKEARAARAKKVEENGN
jgi:hypothetical protein